METIILISFYIALVCGSLLALLLMLSVIGGLDLDLDVGDTDIDAGGLGLVKSVLAFFTFSAWVANIMLSAAVNPVLTAFVSLAVGGLTVALLAWVLNFFLKMQSNVNWEFHQAEGKTGKVYLKIPKDGTGIINVEINGVKREIKALSLDKVEIETGKEILIHEVKKEIAEVTIYE